jgi:hypothetical protein
MDTCQLVVQAAAGMCAALCFVSGVLAAIVWYRSAANNYTISEIKDFLASEEGHLKLAQWLARGSNLNKWAAIWTAISVVAGALCVIFDHLA